jgi:four helix bundle protein
MSEKKNIIREKSFAFALRIVKLFQYLCETKREYVFSKQILRSGTSIGAMVREAEHAESKADFIHKMAIAQKEANETLYWLELMYHSDYLSENEFLSLSTALNEISKILASISLTTKQTVK